MSNENGINVLFADSEFILLESGSLLLNEYLANLQVDTKDKYKRVIMMKELAKKKLKTTILDDQTVSALIKDVNDFYNKKKESSNNSNNSNQNQNKSFKNVIYEDVQAQESDIIKNHYIYKSSIIYVDAFKDIKNISNNVYRQLKINEDVFVSSFSSANDKPKIFINHYNLVRYFVLENPDFRTKFQQRPDSIEISTLDCLVGNTEQVFVIGMLTLNEEGTLQLQDPTKTVNMDVNEVDWGKGYFTQGCIVLVQGVYKSEVFRAKVIVHPNFRWSEVSFKDKYENDFFGAITKAFKSCNNNSNSNETGMMKKIDQETIFNINPNLVKNKPEENFLLNFLNKDLTYAKHLYPKTLETQIHANLDLLSKSNFHSATVEKVFSTTESYLGEEFFIIISNPDLTNPNVLTAIDKIITGYNSHSNSNNSTAIPFMIIFIGNFTPENSYHSFRSYFTIFDNLANIIVKNTQIVKYSYITFIPGPDEFSLYSGFPKHPIIETVINPIRKKLPNIINATNPCRFSFFGKEIVIFRDNLNKKLSRNSVTKCGDISKNKEFYVHTVLNQGNLSPVDLNVTSQIWHLSQAMNILPIPDFLILADVVEDFTMTSKACTVVNPGNFTKDYSFNVVFPLKNIVEPSKINII